MCVPVAVRRRWPLAGAVRSLAVRDAAVRPRHGVGLVGSPRWCCSTRWRPSRAWRAAWRAGAASPVVSAVAGGRRYGPLERPSGWWLVVLVAVWGGGRSVRLRRAYQAELRDRAGRMERAREADTRAARAEERRGSPASCTTWSPTT